MYSTICTKPTRILRAFCTNVYSVDLGRAVRYRKAPPVCDSSLGLPKVKESEGGNVQMRAHFEKVSSDQSVLHVFERVEPVFPFYLHYHPEFELTLILDGHGQRLVGNSVEDYGPGDLVLLGANLPHTYKSGPVDTPGALHRALVVQFRPELLGERFFALPEMRIIRRLLDEAKNGISFSFSANQAKSGAISIIRTLSQDTSSTKILNLLQALCLLSEEAESRSLSLGCVNPLPRVIDQERIDAICQFLCDNYEQEIDYDGLSRKVHMNQASICRFFKKATGRTMTSYVNDYRISVAAQWLTQTNKSILDIAFEVGFGNYSHFNRQFQRSKGKTPGAFRDTFRH
jgi:AraC-like DNA-binding protein/mannose-6-phosphate isomerase-like protein (cupin superfamily)